MSNRIVAGLVAGAAGTLAMQLAGHLDALIRGEAPSRSAAEIGGRLADEIGLPLDYDVDADDTSSDGGSETLDKRIQRRQEALGTLVEIGNGLTIGLLYGVARVVLPKAPSWLAGGALGALSMAAADYPAARLGVTDPERWRGTDWLADVVPHMVYGVVTAATFEIAK